MHLQTALNSQNGSVVQMTVGMGYEFPEAEQEAPEEPKSAQWCTVTSVLAAPPAVKQPSRQVRATLTALPPFETSEKSVPVLHATSSKLPSCLALNPGKYTQALGASNPCNYSCWCDGRKFHGIVRCTTEFAAEIVMPPRTHLTADRYAGWPQNSQSSQEGP